MNNDDICIHCKRSKEEHMNGYLCLNYKEPLYEFKSISQYYAELRGPENLKVMEECSRLADDYFDDSGPGYSYMSQIANKLQEAIEASKPPKE